MSLISMPAAFSGGGPPLAIWVCDWTNDRWHKVRASDGVLLGTVVLPDAFQTIGVYDGRGHIWSAYGGNLGGDVHKIDEAAVTLTTTYHQVGHICSQICTDGTYVWWEDRDGGFVYGRRRNHIATDVIVDHHLAAGDPGLSTTAGKTAIGDGYYYSGGGTGAGGAADRPTKFNADMTVNAQGAPGYVGSGQLAYNSQGPYLYAQTTVGGVLKIRCSDSSIVAHYPLAGHNFVNRIAFDGTYVWVLCTAHNQLHKVDVDNGNILVSYATGNISMGLCYDGSLLWYTNEDAVPRHLQARRASDGVLVYDHVLALAGAGTRYLVVNRFGPAFIYHL